MIVYSAGRRVRVGIASVFPDGISAHFDENPGDDFAKAIIQAITRGAVNALSIAPTPDRDLTLADYIKESG
jgi:phage head maturation protease